LGPAAAAGDVLEARGREGGDDEESPRALRRSGRGELALRVGEAVIRGGRDADGAREPRAEDLELEVGRGHVDEHAVVQRVVTEGALVAPQGALGVGARAEVVVGRGQEAAPREALEGADGVRFLGVGGRSRGHGQGDHNTARPPSEPARVPEASE
jgi:hypothetical protein